MADSLDIFTGILLTVIGLVLVYGSIAYRLIDLILILGVLITIFGLYKLLPAFLMRLFDSKSLQNSGLLGNSKSKKSTLNKKQKKSKSSDAYSRVKESAKEVEGLLNSPSKKEKSKSKSVLQTHDDYYDEGDIESGTTLDEFLSKSKPKEPKPKIETPIDESKQVLKTKPVKEEKPKFKLPSIRKSNAPKKRSFGYLEDGENESSPDTVYFTPNYEKPMKVTRKPKRKSKDTINLSNAPKRSKEISKALASVGEVETIYDSEVSDESYSLIPKTIDEEVILPITEIDLDPQDEVVYNLSQSENTLYNNVIYDEASSDEPITPIYADTEYMEEHGIEEIEYEDYDDGEDYEAPEIETISPVSAVPQRPTSIASTNPIASKKDNAANLSRPHKRQVVLPSPKPKEEPISSESKSAIPRPKAKEKSVIPRPSPKAKDSDLSSEVPLSDLLDSPEESITIDPNNPESLPIPKLLNSYVICDKGILTSQEAFEEVANHSKEEILLEAPTIKDMGERFLSSISKIKSRVIIQEFDIEDISYVLLLSSLIKKGVEIKTLPSVNSFNLIGDSSHALLISSSLDEDDFEYGAVYTDEDSINSIKELFESSWKIANNLDSSILEN